MLNFHPSESQACDERSLGDVRFSGSVARNAKQNCMVSGGLEVGV